jgi:uncharacterized protein YbjT (DUF2867 family)
VVEKLVAAGHDVVAASPSTGVNALTGEGVAEALTGAEVVVDVANSPSFEAGAVLDFFERSGRNLLAAETLAGVKHHVALSIVGTDLLPENGYFRAKVAQERLVEASGVPYTIVRATQFFEFVGAIAEAAAVDGRIVVPDADFQPIAAADVAAALVDVAQAAPLNGRVDIAGPDKAPFRDFITRRLSSSGDGRPVSVDRRARYFGATLETGSLVPNANVNPRLGTIGFDTWLAGV